MSDAKLQRRLGMWDGIAIGVGSVIGVGIFRTTGQALRSAGGLPFMFAMWILVGAVSLAGARGFGRAAVRIPEVGGPYAIVREALGRRAAFVDGWFGAAVSIPARQAAQMAIMGEVLALELGGTAKRWALVTLAALYVTHLAGARVGAGIQRVLSVLKILLIGGAIATAFAGPALAPTSAAIAPLPLGVGLAGVFYTYLGWHDVTHLAEELRAPERSLPRVLVGTVAVVMLAYVGWVVGLTYAYGSGPVAQGDLPIRALALAHYGRAGEWSVTWGMFACMLGAAAEGVLVRPRLWYALARDRIAPGFLGSIDARGVPRAALTLQCGLMGVLVALGSFAELLVVLSLAQAISSSLEAASVVVLERRWGTRLPLPILAFAAANVLLVAFLTIQDPKPLLGALAIFIGLAVVARFVHPAAQPQAAP